MKLNHIVLKPQRIELKDINNDVPTYGEIFAELMQDLVDLAKGRRDEFLIAPWSSRAAAIQETKKQIRALLAEIVVYKDIDDNGPSYTIYENGVCIGSYLSDDLFVKECLAGKHGRVKIKGGIDNRS